jgi:hypothetical protein
MDVVVPDGTVEAGAEALGCCRASCNEGGEEPHAGARRYSPNVD